MASGAPASSSGNEAVDEVIVCLSNLEELLFLLAGSGPQADVLCKKLLLAVPACVLIHLKQHRTLLAALKQAALSRQNAAFQSGISPGKKPPNKCGKAFQESRSRSRMQKALRIGCLQISNWLWE